MDTEIPSIDSIPHLTHVTSALSLPRHSTSKIENLIEYTTIPEDAIVANATLPVISPYNIYRKRVPRSIRTLLLFFLPGPKSKNMSNPPEWISVIFHRPPENNILLLPYPQIS